MATSSIFTRVKINDPEKAKRFIDAIEASEKARCSAPRPAAIPTIKNHNDIRKLMAKRTTK